MNVAKCLRNGQRLLTLHYGRSYVVAHPDEHSKILLSTGDESFATNLSQLGGYSGAVNRRPQQKAFSGKGHTLSSSSDSRKVRVLHTITLWIT